MGLGQYVRMITLSVITLSSFHCFNCTLSSCWLSEVLYFSAFLFGKPIGFCFFALGSDSTKLVLRFGFLLPIWVSTRTGRRIRDPHDWILSPRLIIFTVWSEELTFQFNRLDVKTNSTQCFKIKFYNYLPYLLSTACKNRATLIIPDLKLRLWWYFKTSRNKKFIFSVILAI